MTCIICIYTFDIPQHSLSKQGTIFFVVDKYRQIFKISSKVIRVCFRKINLQNISVQIVPARFRDVKSSNTIIMRVLLLFTSSVTITSILRVLM